MSNVAGCLAFVYVAGAMFAYLTWWVIDDEQIPPLVVALWPLWLARSVARAVLFLLLPQVK